MRWSRDQEACRQEMRCRTARKCTHAVSSSHFGNVLNAVSPILSFLILNEDNLETELTDVEFSCGDIFVTF